MTRHLRHIALDALALLLVALVLYLGMAIESRIHGADEWQGFTMRLSPDGVLRGRLVYGGGAATIIAPGEQQAAVSVVLDDTPPEPLEALRKAPLPPAEDAPVEAYNRWFRTYLAWLELRRQVLGQADAPLRRNDEFDRAEPTSYSKPSQAKR